MELDDLRRQWQQLAPVEAPAFSPAEWERLLARNAGGLVEKMRRNTWYEAIFTALIVATVPFYTWSTWGQVINVMMAAALLLLSVILLVNYYQQLQLLRRMTFTDAQVRTHLGALCAGLRRKLHFYYRLTIATLPCTLLMMLCFNVGKELAHPGAFRWKFMVALAAAYVVLGAIMQVGMMYLTRWYLQRLYGQHLDRLEGSLRELDGDETGLTG